MKTVTIIKAVPKKCIFDDPQQEIEGRIFYYIPLIKKENACEYAVRNYVLIFKTNIFNFKIILILVFLWMLRPILKLYQIL